MIALFRDTPSRIALANVAASSILLGNGGAAETVSPRRILAEFSSMFELMKLGHTTLTLTPNLRASSRSDSENPTTACFVAE